MNLYVETSAALRAILGGDDDDRIRDLLAVEHEVVVTSRLTPRRGGACRGPAARLARAVTPLAILSTDDRVRRNAEALGFEVLP